MEITILPGNFAKIKNEERQTLARCHALIDGSWSGMTGGIRLAFLHEGEAMGWFLAVCKALLLEGVKS